LRLERRVAVTFRVFAALADRPRGAGALRTLAALRVPERLTARRGGRAAVLVERLDAGRVFALRVFVARFLAERVSRRGGSLGSGISRGDSLATGDVESRSAASLALGLSGCSIHGGKGRSFRIRPPPPPFCLRRSRARSSGESRPASV
jgi:hypothetical protein